jgi:hypothetical protein
MCDTVCVVTADRVLFGKNSDREPGEAQGVELIPARSGRSGAVRCTHVQVPQVERTRAVLLSRPAWMWGGEMGANDAGVVAGNEAVFTRFKAAKRGLTGMDLLRLALERAATAREAAQVVIELVAVHPQGGRMGFRNQNFSYFSSFLFADAREAWVLETAGLYWALEKVRRLDVDPTAFGPFPRERADEASLWWWHERLHRAVLGDWEARSGVVEAERAMLEAKHFGSADVPTAWAEHREVLPAWLGRVEREPVTSGAAPLFRAWWRRQTMRDFAVAKTASERRGTSETA